MEFFIYIGKASLILTAFWLVYKLFLERESFHRFKRWYLNAGFAVSMVLPLLYYTRIKVVSASIFSTPTSIPVKKAVNSASTSGWQNSFDIMQYDTVFVVIYAAIALFLLIRFLVKFIRLKVFLNAQTYTTIEGVKYVQTKRRVGAYSFLNTVVFNPEMYTAEQLKSVLAHERAHVSCKHSYDIISAHLYKSLFWCNPFAWLYQQTLSQNSEFEADAIAAQMTTVKSYQMALYHITKQQVKHQLEHSFHQSPIKKRIIMLNNTQHPKKNLWKVFLIFPLLCSFFLLFQVETKAQETSTYSETKLTENRFSITYDGTSTKSELQENARILKETFNIDVVFTDLVIRDDGTVKAMTLNVDCNDGFKGSASSPNLKEKPIYFFRDSSESTEKPFGIGLGTLNHKTTTTFSSDKISFDDLNDIKTIVIDGKSHAIEDLRNAFITVQSITHDKTSKTLRIKTLADLNTPVFSSIADLMDKAKKTYGNEMDKELKFLKINEDLKISQISILEYRVNVNSSYEVEVPIKN